MPLVPPLLYASKMAYFLLNKEQYHPKKPEKCRIQKVGFQQMLENQRENSNNRIDLVVCMYNYIFYHAPMRPMT